MQDDNLNTLYAVATGRKTYYQPTLDSYTAENGLYRFETHEEAAPGKANLISSLMPDGTQLPVIDCDYVIQAVPSSTLGHYHLYIDKPLTWEQYASLLDGFYKAGLIEKAWYKNAIREHRSYVRLPNVKKPPETASKAATKP